MPSPLFIPTAEAAYIAGLTDRQMNRVVDEGLVPASLFERRGSSRRFTRLGAAFAKFYYSTEDQLLAGARRHILDELNVRVEQLAAKEPVLALNRLDYISWKVKRKHIEVDVLPFLQEALDRTKEVIQAGQMVSTDPDIMGGAPVFVGTRVPIAMVLGSLATGIKLDRLKASYPFLTEAHIQAAKVHAAVHPRSGRPRRLADVNPVMSGRVTRVVKHDSSA